MELQFKQIAIAQDGNTILGLTEDGAVYYKIGPARGGSGWRPVTMNEVDEASDEQSRQARIIG